MDSPRADSEERPVSEAGDSTGLGDRRPGLKTLLSEPKICSPNQSTCTSVCGPLKVLIGSIQGSIGKIQEPLPTLDECHCQFRLRCLLAGDWVSPLASYNEMGIVVSASLDR